MQLILVISLVALFLQGCSNTPQEPTEEEIATQKAEQRQAEEAELAMRGSDSYLYYYITHSPNAEDSDSEVGGTFDVQTNATGYGHKHTFNGEKSLILSEVVSKMADQLLHNYQDKSSNELIALTSLIDLNNHSATNWLGQTVSEQFMHELHTRNLRVIDYKLTGKILVTQSGEFALSRDWNKLNKNVDVSRILTGTMSRNEEGVIFNVRIVNAITRMVESTASAFIPHHIFVGGDYDYRPAQYISRNSSRHDGKAQVTLVK